MPERVQPSGRERAEVERRRRLLLSGLGLAGLVAFVIGVVSGAGGGDPADPVDDAEAAPVAELPGGGTTILPDRRVVAYYGAPRDPALGTLGIGTPDEMAERLDKQARPYDTEKQPVLPAMELISTVAAQEPGETGDYNLQEPKALIEKYHAAARAAGAILILDIQPGHADFMSEVRRLEEFLVEPDVSLALDPEWHVRPPDVPGAVIGSVDAAEVNEVSAYLDDLVASQNLPQKLLILHRFTPNMVADVETLEPRDNLAIVLNSDGFSDPVNKVAKYDELRPRGPTDEFYPGFKLFYEEDFPLMTPEEVLDLKHPPDFIVYE